MLISNINKHSWYQKWKYIPAACSKEIHLTDEFQADQGVNGPFPHEPEANSTDEEYQAAEPVENRLTDTMLLNETLHPSWKDKEKQ